MPLRQSGITEMQFKLELFHCFGDFHIASYNIVAGHLKNTRNKGQVTNVHLILF